MWLDRARQHIYRSVLVPAAAVLALSLFTAPLLPLFDPDEGYYPATAVETMRTGSLWDVRLNGEPRWDKPYLPYALVEASFAILGESVTAARLPSGIQAAMLVLLAGLIVGRLAGTSAGASSAWVLATTLAVQIFSRVAHPEIGVVLGITASELLFVLWVVERSRRQWWLAIAAGVCVGYGTLAKGPVAVVLPVLMVAAFACIARGVDWTGALRDAFIAALAAAAIAMPWYLAMTARHGMPFLAETLWRHNVGRFSGAEFGHHKPFWFFVLPTIVAVFPWTAFVPGAMRGISWRASSAENVLRLAMAIAACTSFLFYSLSVSKLPHYAFVVVPPLAILVGVRLDALRRSRTSPKFALAVTAGLFAGLAALLISLPWAPHVVNPRILFGGAPLRDRSIEALVAEPAWMAAAVLIAAAGAVTFIRVAARRQAVLTAVGMLLPLVLLVAAQPLLHATYPWERLGRHVSAAAEPIWLIGPRAPSLAFYAGRPVLRLAPEDVETGLPETADGWIVAPTDWLERATRSDPLCRLRLKVIDRSGSMTLLRASPREGSHPCRRDVPEAHDGAQ